MFVFRKIWRALFSYNTFLRFAFLPYYWASVGKNTEVYCSDKALSAFPYWVYIYWTCVCSSRQVSLDSWKLWHWNNFSGFCFSFCVADLEHVYSYREAQSHQRRSLNIFIQLIRPNKSHTLTLSLWDICSNIFYIFEQVWEY